MAKSGAAYIGVADQNVPLQCRVRSHNLPVENGILVVSILPKSPAQQVGLLLGDMIAGDNDQPITCIDDLHRRLTKEQIGVRWPLTVIRHTEKLVLNVVLVESHTGVQE